jgi:hypothetical protein
MSVEKMSLSFPSRLARLVRREAKREGMSVSAWVARAAARATKLAEARRLLEAYEREHGLITEDELERVRRVWPA